VSGRLEVFHEAQRFAAQVSIVIRRGGNRMAPKAKVVGWHEDKLCALACCCCRVDLKELRPLVKNAKYICKECGRAAAKASSLCHPARL
jgi:hypothetical protein